MLKHDFKPVNRGDLERGRLSASNQAIAEDGDEDIIFERKPRERKEKNKKEDEGGKPNVSLKWKGLELQDEKESEKDSVKKTANKKNHTLYIRCGQDNFIFLPWGLFADYKENE